MTIASPSRAPNSMTMVFHAPYPLNPTASSASGVRPVQMLKAFRDLGYRVLEVTGTSGERKQAIRAVKRHLREGGSVDFVYSECSTMPTPLTDPHHLPLHPFADAGFFRFMKRRRVPVGVFYRDIHWLFPEYLQAVNKLVAVGTRAFYRADLLGYRAWVDRVYVPSTQMATRIPYLRPDQFAELPPGCTIVDPGDARQSVLTLFYVGSVSNFIYRLHACVQGIVRVPGTRLILCTHEDQWRAVSHEYPGNMKGVIEIVSGSGADLERYYAEADICALFLEPVPYFAMAAPVKLYEYIGHGKPVIASAGTLSGEFVSEHGVGWTLPYNADALTDLLNRLREHPDELEEVRQRVLRERHNHTWLARARQVADDLTTLRQLNAVASA